jgi:hypothetical protein
VRGQGHRDCEVGLLEQRRGPVGGELLHCMKNMLRPVTFAQSLKAASIHSHLSNTTPTPTTPGRGQSGLRPELQEERHLPRLREPHHPQTHPPPRLAALHALRPPPARQRPGQASEGSSSRWKSSVADGSGSGRIPSAPDSSGSGWSLLAADGSGSGWSASAADDSGSGRSLSAADGSSSGRISLAVHGSGSG